MSLTVLTFSFNAVDCISRPNEDRRQLIALYSAINYEGHDEPVTAHMTAVQIECYQELSICLLRHGDEQPLTKSPFLLVSLSKNRAQKGGLAFRLYQSRTPGKVFFSRWRPRWPPFHESGHNFRHNSAQFEIMALNTRNDASM